MKSTGKIIIASLLVLFIGFSVAYYNTGSFGYDKHSLVTVTDEYISIFDYNIYYDKIEKEFNEIKKKAPDNFITMN